MADVVRLAARPRNNDEAVGGAFSIDGVNAPHTKSLCILIAACWRILSYIDKIATHLPGHVQVHDGVLVDDFMRAAA